MNIKKSWAAVVLAIVASICGSACPSARAAVTTWYVSTTGSDTGNSGTTSLSPFRTISHAVSVSNTSDTIIVATGTYNENVTLTKGGSAGAPFVLTSASGAQPTISGFGNIAANGAWSLYSGSGTNAVYKSTVGSSGTAWRIRTLYSRATLLSIAQTGSAAITTATTNAATGICTVTVPSLHLSFDLIRSSFIWVYSGSTNANYSYYINSLTDDGTTTTISFLRDSYTVVAGSDSLQVCNHPSITTPGSWSYEDPGDGRTILYYAPGAASLNDAQAQQNGNPIIKANNLSYVTVNGFNLCGSSWTGFYCTSCNNVTLQQCTVYDNNNGQNWGVQFSTGTNNAVQNCIITGNYDGFTVQNQNNFLFKNSMVCWNQDDGVDFSGSNNQITVKQCYIHDHLGIGHNDSMQFDANSNAQNVLLDSSWMAYSGQSIMCQCLTSATASNCVFMASTAPAINGSLQWTVKNCTFAYGLLGAGAYGDNSFFQNNIFLCDSVDFDRHQLSSDYNLFWWQTPVGYSGTYNGIVAYTSPPSTSYASSMLSQLSGSTGCETHSTGANPLFHNAPFAVANLSSYNATRDQLTLKSITHCHIDSKYFAQGDKVEVNGDGVLHTITAVTYPDAYTATITINPALSYPTYRGGFVYDWPSTTGSTTMDFRLSGTSPALTCGTNGSRVGSTIDTVQFATQYCFDGSGNTSVPTVTSDIQAMWNSPLVYFPYFGTIYKGMVINNPSVQNVTTGTTSIVFTVTLQPVTQTSTVVYSSSNGTALAGTDYAATSGTLTIPAYTSYATISVPVYGNPNQQPNKTFTMKLSNAVNGTIATSTGTGTIISAPVVAPVISSTLSVTGTVNTAFSYSTTATNYPTGFYVTGTIPAGLSYNNSTGVLSGTPTQTGTFTPVISATNSKGTGSATLTLTVVLPGVPPVITSPATATGTVGYPFSYQITATNSPTSFGAAPVPGGVSVNTGNGLISGTPTTAGTTNCVISATNAYGSGTGPLTISVIGVVATPTLSLVSGTFTVDQQVTASCGTPGAVIHYTTNGATPTSGDPVISPTQPATITTTGTLKAIAFCNGYVQSPMVSGTYKITGQVASGADHTVALRSDGTVWAWGFNNNGQLGNGTTTLSATGVQVLSSTGAGYLTGIVSVAAGMEHSLALTGSGTVWGWGYNNNYQLGTGTNARQTRPVQMLTGASQPLTGIVAIAACGYHNLMLKSDGTVWASGANGDGQLGTGNTNAAIYAVQVTGLSGSCKAVGCGYAHSLVVRNDGTVWAFGRNDQGELGNNTTTQQNTPVQVLTGTSTPLTGIVAVGGGYYHSAALANDGTVWGCGGNGFGQLGDTTTTRRSMAVQAVSVSNAIGLAVGYDHTVALKNDGTVLAWGENEVSELGDGTLTDRQQAVTMTGVSGVQNIAAGPGRTLLVNISGAVYGLGDNVSGEIGNGLLGSTPTPYNPGLISVSHVSGGWDHTLVHKSDGTVWASGQGIYGQLGNNGTNNVSTFVQVTDGAGNLTNISNISAGSCFGLALTNTGMVRSWGQNTNGQLGDGSTTQRNQPVYVLTASGTLSGISAISAGQSHSLALASDKTVWAWGYNSSGQLGDNSTTQRTQPVQVLTASGTLSNVMAIAAGYNYSLALTTSGTVYAWGLNSNGQLGNGTTTSGSVAAPISLTGTTIKAIAAGANFSFGITNVNTLLGWGYNYNGQLGNGTTTQSNVPVQVTGTINSYSVAAITAGGAFTLATTTNGAVWAWGSNGSYQLANTGGQTTTPAVIAGLTALSGSSSVECGDTHAILINSDLTISTWGDRGCGQLGDGHFNYAPTPTAATGIVLVGF